MDVIERNPLVPHLLVHKIHKIFQLTFIILVVLTSSTISLNASTTLHPQTADIETNSNENVQTSTTPAILNSSTLSTTTLSPPNSNSSRNSTTIPISSPSTSIYCPCDLQLTSCDINCCCDPDCNESERAVFSPCEDSSNINPYHNRRHCHRKDYFYRNNTPFYMEVHQNELFCIVTNNLNKEEQIPELPLDIGIALKANKPKYDWNVKHSVRSGNSTEYFSGYKFGSKIETVNMSNSSQYHVDSLWLPYGLFGSTCNSKQPILFLKDTNSFCQATVSNLSLQCSQTDRLDATTFLKDIYILQNPGVKATHELVNITYLECPDTDLKTNCSRVDDLKSPNLDPTSLLCSSVLQILHLSIVHRGISGISAVTAKMHYANYSAFETQLSQQFGVTFEWTKNPKEDAGTRPYFKKSGNPGYIVGKPVIAGTAVVPEKSFVIPPNATQEDTDRSPETIDYNKITTKKSYIAQSSDEKNNWLTVQSSGVCNGTRKPILFGMDINVMCTLDITKFDSCEALQYQIGEILLGGSPEHFSDRYVSSFGNPTFSSSLDNWVPIILSSENPFGTEDSSSFGEIDAVGCEGIITSLQIPILFARVGSVNFPQSKILSVLFEYGPPVNIPKKSIRGNSTGFVLRSSASFVDTTSSPTTKVPQWPVISIKLPTDFFYPFSASSSLGSRVRYGYNYLKFLSVLLGSFVHFVK